MPNYRVSVVLQTVIDTSSPERARRIAFEGATALIQQEDAAEAEFNNVMPQEKAPRFVYLEENINPEDLKSEEEELDNAEENL